MLMLYNWIMTANLNQLSKEEIAAKKKAEADNNGDRYDSSEDDGGFESVEAPLVKSTNIRRARQNGENG